MSPVTQQRQRFQIRQSIGVALGALDTFDGSLTHTADDTGGVNTIRDNSLAFGSRDNHRGKWVVATGATDSGEIRRVSESDPDARELRVSVGFTSQTDTSFSYELWDADVSPIMVHDFINQAIADVTRKGSVPVTDSSIHLGGDIYNFPLPSDMVGVQRVESRSAFRSKTVRNLDAVMANPQTNVTVAADTEDFREGSASNKITIAAGFSTGQVINDTFTAIDLSGMTHLEGWAKTNLATTASTLDLFLNDTSTEQLSLPALTADTWTWFSLALNNPESDTAIATFGLKSDSDWGGSSATVVWLDGVRASRDGSQVYKRLHRRFWDIEPGERRIEFEKSAVPGYDAGLIRLTGRRVPALLSSDTDICEADSNFVIDSVVARMLRARTNISADRRDAAALEADRREARAQMTLARMETPRPSVVWSDAN